MKKTVIVRAVLSLMFSVSAVACATAQGPRYHYGYSWKGGAVRSMPIVEKHAAVDRVTETALQHAARANRQHEALDEAD